MKLTHRTLWFITGLIVLALTGLIVLQYVLLRNAYDLRQQAFERNVYAAMGAMVQKLESEEALGNVFHIALSASHPMTTMKVLSFDADSVGHATHPDSISMMMTSTAVLSEPPIRIKGNELQYRVARPQHVTLQVVNLAGRSDTTLVDTFRLPGDYAVRVTDASVLKGEIVVKYVADSNTVMMRTVNGDVRDMTSGDALIKKRTEILGRAFDNLSFLEREPLEKRIRPTLLDSVVGGTLKESGIEIPYAYGLLADRSDSLSMVKPAGFDHELRSSPFHNRLFPSDLLFSQNSIALFFPGQSVFLLKQMAPLLGLSILFTVVIVACFAYTIRTILRQRQFSVRLVDFINNMTHEFKTPISTIAVAAETLVRPEVLGQQEKILRYSAVIQDENTRMKRQVDKILQMAVLEEGNYKLSMTDVDLHDVVQKAVDNISLQVEAKGGRITSRLGAADAVVRADALHLSNVIHSVLDNANKYSPERPAIAIETLNERGYVVVEIADNGIGISREDQQKVFEKYFRVHTGNVHDVKGFGLGLSYVKLMTEAHGGDVALASEPGKGTTVRLRFPMAGRREG